MQNSNPIVKGSLTTIVLKLLSENKRMYGYEITRKVRELTNGEWQITEGALYPSLHKLEAEGMLEVTIEQMGNRPRKYYSLTQKGTKESTKKLAEIKSFFEQMQLILNIPGLAIKL